MDTFLHVIHKKGDNLPLISGGPRYAITEIKLIIEFKVKLTVNLYLKLYLKSFDRCRTFAAV